MLLNCRQDRFQTGMAIYLISTCRAENNFRRVEEFIQTMALNFSDSCTSYRRRNIVAWEKEFSRCDEVDFHRIDNLQQ